MNTSKIGRNEPCPCGSTKKYKHCCFNPKFITQNTKAPALDARTMQILAQGKAAYEKKIFRAAEDCCKVVLKAMPSNTDALYILGMINLDKGLPEIALNYMDRASENIADSTDDTRIEIFTRKSTALAALTRFSEAAECCRQALEIAPDSSVLLTNYGAMLIQFGEHGLALNVLSRASQLDPTKPKTFDLMGAMQCIMGDLPAAEKSLRTALSLDPNSISAQANLGKVLLGLGRSEEALEKFLGVITIASDDITSLNAAAEILYNQLHTDRAYALFDQVCQIQPTIAHRLIRDVMTLIPPVSESREQISRLRCKLDENLDKLMQDDTVLTDPDLLIYNAAISIHGLTAFYWAFHGLNDINAMRKLAKLYTKICPALEYQADNITSKPKTEKIKIGFFSMHVQDHSVSRSFANAICSLALQPQFEIILLSTEEVSAEGKINLYSNFRGQFVNVPSAYHEARRVIQEENLNVLIYQDIGMNLLSYFLAFARLAQHQCVMGGHPVTTGIPNIDYYISSALMEPNNGQDHYSEKLIALPGPDLHLRFTYPTLPVCLKGREAFGLPMNGALYICPMMLQKMHPDFDEAIEKLLDIDPTGYVILIENPKFKWHEMVKKRLEKTIRENSLQRVIFLPWIVDPSEFMALISVSDVVLDPFHFGIGTTGIPVFATDTPIITWPSNYMRGRVGMVYCNILEIPECIASDLNEYATKAHDLAHNENLKQQVRNRIRNNKHRLFENNLPPRQLIDFFNSFIIEGQIENNAIQTSLLSA
jgi:protein O-GlcNAc transferase